MFHRLVKSLARSELEKVIAKVPLNCDWIKAMVQSVVIEAIKMVLLSSSW